MAHVKTYDKLDLEYANFFEFKSESDCHATRNETGSSVEQIEKKNRVQQGNHDITNHFITKNLLQWTLFFAPVIIVKCMKQDSNITNA